MGGGEGVEIDLKLSCSPEKEISLAGSEFGHDRLKPSKTKESEQKQAGSHGVLHHDVCVWL